MIAITIGIIVFVSLNMRSTIECNYIQPIKINANLQKKDGEIIPNNETHPAEIRHTESTDESTIVPTIREKLHEYVEVLWSSVLKG